MIKASNIEDNIKNLLTKKYKAVELVDHFLGRIKKFDGKVNSFITATEDSAYEKARRIDKIISQNTANEIKKRYPLLGSVVAHKDLFLTKGTKTTAASNVLRDYYPQYSSTVVERLEKAGCIMIGKLNCDAWAHGSSGENSDFGPARNPWNLDRTPGGSSSGSGAALAGDFCHFTTGTDTCGSIRLPANYCYKVGLKPTYGSVSRYGVIAMASSLDSVGHLTNTVDDSRRILNVTKGHDGHDSTLKQESFKFDKKKIKIGIPKEFFVEGLDRAVGQNITKAIEILKKAGVEFQEISLPHTKYGLSVYYIIQPAEVSSNLGRYDGIRYGGERNLFGNEAKRRIMLGSFVLSSGYYDAYYLKAMKVRTMIKSEVDKAFTKVNAIIAPVAPTPPFALGEKTEDPLTMYLTDIYAATANLSGIASIAIPFGFTNDELPLGFQLMGPRFSEEMLFYIGETFEKYSDYEAKFAPLQ